MSSDQPKKVKAILYTDGGYRAQYASGGWGIHGYTFEAVPPTKGTGNPKAIPTATGYVAEKADAELVTILNYVDGTGGVFPAFSSNHTELAATTRALEWVVENKVSETTLYTDSRYVTDGLTKWLPKWKQRGFVNGEGNPVANKELWLKADYLMTQMKEVELNVSINWIKGHVGHFGNEQADGLATKGNVLGRKGTDYTHLVTTDPSGYWGAKATHNRMLSSGKWYLQTTDLDFLTERGETIYYLGEHTTLEGVEMPGKRNSDNALVVLYMKEPDPVLEILRKQAIDLDTRKFGAVLVGRLDGILLPDTYTEALKYGTLFMDWDTHRMDIVGPKRRPLLKEMSPAGQVYVTVDALSVLQTKLDAFLRKDPGIWITDITDLLYEAEEKKGVKVVKVRKDFVQTTRYLDIPVRYSTKKVGDITGLDDASVKSVKVRFITGIDLARRNMLNNIAADDVKVSAITWRESSQVIRYATVVESSNGTGIWAGVDSNYLLVNEKSE